MDKEIPKTNKLEVLEKNLENYKRELGMYPKKLSRLQEIRQRTVDQIEVRKRLLPIVTKGIEKTESSTKFEEDPEYWECQRVLLRLNHESELQQLEDGLESYDENIENVKKEIARIEGEIPKVEAQIAELRGE